MAGSEAIIYIIDDDAAVRDSLASLISTMEMNAKTFSSAEEFLAAFDPSRHGCVVTDVRMLGMSGLDLQDHLSARGIEIPIIIVTAHADVRVAVRAMRGGAVILLEKPCRDQELWDAICEALALDAKTRDKHARRDDILARAAKLTRGERQVMELLVAGKANKVMAKELGVSVRTVEARRQNIFKKLQVSSVAEVVQLASEVPVGERIGVKR